MDTQAPKEDLEKPEQIIDDIAAGLRHIQDAFIASSIRSGHIIESVLTLRILTVGLGSASTTNSDTVDIYKTYVEQLRAIRDQVSAEENYTVDLPRHIQSIEGSASTLVAATATTAAYFGIPELSTFDPYAVDTPENHEQYVERFTKYDRALGTTYRAIWEAYYGTRSDPGRSALYLLRQAFDTLFNKLAPDNEVRKSEYYSVKKETEQVTRVERIKYAAATHVKDTAKAHALITSAEHMNAVYQDLNAAHSRDLLDERKTRLAICEMGKILEDWADAIRIGL